MSKLLPAIEADAARGLVLPPGTPLGGEVSKRFKRFLHRCLLRTRYAHNQGGSGREIVGARTHAVDLVFRYALQAAESLPGYLPASQGAAVVALGGYGRCELSPHSDIDIQFLHDGPPISEKPPRPAFMELLEESWILQRLPRRCRASCAPRRRPSTAGNQDLRSKTSLIEARWVWATPSLVRADEAARLVRAASTGQETAYVCPAARGPGPAAAAVWNTPYLQEPNLKNGCGGLRDYQNLVWLTFFRTARRPPASCRSGA